MPQIDFGRVTMVWQVGPVQDFQAHFSGSGFSIRDETGRPMLTLGYLSRVEANAARDLIVKALENAKYVGPRR
jgi:hypothetical protein